MNQQCQCTHPIHTPPVVVGGRYVVGPEPTYHRNGREFPRLHGAGMTVTVFQGPDDDGDVWVEEDDVAGIWAVDPRHLMPAPDQPAEAPAIDDDLLRELAFAVGHEASRMPTLDGTRRLLASEPTQRLRAAWTAEERERAEGYRRQLQQYEAERAVQGDARAELERLRAAQPQLPEVAREGLHGQFRIEDRTYWFPLTSADSVRRDGLDRLAIAALLDAEEAAGARATTDDEEPASSSSNYVSSVLPPQASTCTRCGALVLWVQTHDQWHRARSGQDGAQ